MAARSEIDHSHEISRKYAPSPRINVVDALTKQLYNHLIEIPFAESLREHRATVDNSVEKLTSSRCKTATMTMPDLSSRPLSDLIACCQENTRDYLRTREANNDSHCLELFRRAVQGRDEGAWAFIYTFYSTEEFLGDHYLLKWVRSWMHGRHGALIRAAYTEEEFVQEIWLRFMHSDAGKAFTFESMAHLMAYLRRLVNNFALDVTRRRAPTVVEALTEGEAINLEQAIRRVPASEGDPEELIARQESLEILLSAVWIDIVATNHEWLVFQDHFLEGLPPREVYRLHPDTFVANEVEITRTRLARRMRKAPFLLNHYIRLLVLQDDEKLTTVFQHSILEGASDDWLLAHFSRLFRSRTELNQTKTLVMQAIRSRPALLQILSS